MWERIHQKSGNRRRGERRLREKLTQKNEPGPDLAESEAVAWQPVVQTVTKITKDLCAALNGQFITRFQQISSTKRNSVLPISQY